MGNLNLIASDIDNSNRETKAIHRKTALEKVYLTKTYISITKQDLSAKTDTMTAHLTMWADGIPKII